MGLHLTGKGSILDTLGHAAGDVGGAIGGAVKGIGSGLANTVTGDIVEPIRAEVGAVTGNQAAEQAANQRASIDQQRSIPYQLLQQGTELGQSGYNLLFKEPIESLIGNEPASNRAFQTGMKELNSTFPGQIVAPVERGLANIGANRNPMGPDTASIQRSIGLDPTESVGKQAANAAVNAALLALPGHTGEIKATAKAVAEKTTPLDEVGGINNAKPIPAPEEPLSLSVDAENNIHANNPYAPKDAVAPAIPEPNASDLEAATKAAENATAPEIDFTKVDGANKMVADAVAGRANMMRQIDGSAKGGQLTMGADGTKIRTSDHTPFYRQVYAETGRKPTVADYKAEAERQLRTGADEESKSYQDMVRHAHVEDELKSYEQANRQSGYNKVKVRNAPAGTPRNIPSWVREKINSPEYIAKRGTGELLQRVRDELPIARAHVKALDRQIKSLGKAGNIRGITKLNADNAAARLRLRILEGMERTQAEQYRVRAQTLDDKYPDVELKQKGARGKVTVSGTPVKGSGVRIAPVEGSPQAVDSAPYEGYQPNSPVPSYEEQVAANARKAGVSLEEFKRGLAEQSQTAFTPQDIQKLEAMNGHYTDEEAGASYSPDHDLSIPGEPKAPVARSLEGDTAAFNVLHEGGTIDAAIKAYREATGVSAEDAKLAVNDVAETGVDMGSNEDVLRRNPFYGQLADFGVQSARDVADKAKSYRNVSGALVGHMNDLAKGLNEHDVELLDKLRGNSIADVARRAEDPTLFSKVAQAAKDISDYNHEIRRQQGDITIYRQNYGAGMHYSDVTPDEQAAVSGYRDNLASTPGFTRERRIGDYNEAATKYNLTRKNANFLEDVAHDSRQTLNYVTERSVHGGLQDVYGQNAVHYGSPTFEQPRQLNGTKDVFATKEVAKEWNKLNPQQRERTVFGKAYDSINSLVTQAIVLNPVFHGSNQLWQAGEAVGKLKGPIGLTELGKNVAGMSAEDTRSAALGIYEHGGDIPDYGVNNHGLISRLTHGTTDVARKGMATIEFRLRTAAYKTLTDEGMDGRTAVKTLEQFMGDQHSFDIASRRFTIFLHYFKTLTTSQLSQILHPIENAGTLANKATMLAVLYGANYAWQQFTGNKHAYIRAPGGAGLIKEEVAAGENVAKGHYRQALSILTNRINPIPKEAAQQLFNQDLYTGQDLSTAGGRGTHAENALVSPAQLGSRVTSGRKSAAEFAANELQLNTPHTKGAPAAPSGKLDVLNTPGSKPVAGPDKTGIDQQNSYFDSVEQAKRTLPAARQKVYDSITAGETDPNGQPIGMNDKQAQAHYAALYGNPDVLAAVVKQKQDYAKATSSPLDPLYSPDLTDAQRREYLHMQSLPYKGDDYIQQQGANKDWLQQLTKDRVAYFATQDYSGAPPSERISPPSFDEATQSDLDTVAGLSGPDKAHFIDAHPNVQQAYDAIAKYTNDRRVAEGNAPFKPFPHADTETQSILNTYMNLPTGDGKNGGNASRSAWIKAHPADYAKMQNYFASEAEWEVANSAGQDKFQGSTPSQQELKSVYSLGKYDIAKQPDGTYVVSPAEAYASAQAATQNSGLATAYNNMKANNQRREAVRSVKFAGRSKKIITKSFAQNKRKLSHYNSHNSVKVAKAKQGKLRIKSTAVA